jgi:hypothetical protein
LAISLGGTEDALTNPRVDYERLGDAADPHRDDVSRRGPAATGAAHPLRPMRGTAGHDDVATRVCPISEQIHDNGLAQSHAYRARWAQLRLHAGSRFHSGSKSADTDANHVFLTQDGIFRRQS